MIYYHCSAMLISLFGDHSPLLGHVDHFIWWSSTAAQICWSLYCIWLIIYRCLAMLITLLSDHLPLLSHVDHSIWWSSTAAQAVITLFDDHLPLLSHVDLLDEWVLVVAQQLTQLVHHPETQTKYSTVTPQYSVHTNDKENKYDEINCMKWQILARNF